MLTSVRFELTKEGNRMLTVIRRWYKRNFSDPQVVILAFLLLAGLLVMLLAGKLLAPLLVSAILAYLLEGAVYHLQRLRLPRLPAVIIVFVFFFALVLATLLLLMPMLSRQVTQLVRELPNMVAQGQVLLMQLPERYPTLVSAEQVNEIVAAIRTESLHLGQQVVNLTLASALHLFNLLVYLVVVPLLVFFLLKDKQLILTWLTRLLPKERGLAAEVWSEVNLKIASYVRGKFIEVLIVWLVSFVTFFFLGLNYALLLSLAVGLSVIVPYVGAVAVAIPVALVAYFQWGFGSSLTSVMIAYAVIQFLDGNVLATLLFAEVVKLHPAAIIAAVIIFGGLWGFVGVFFAIPLATLVQAVIRSWPSQEEVEEMQLDSAT